MNLCAVRCSSYCCVCEQKTNNLKISETTTNIWSCRWDLIQRWWDEILFIKLEPRSSPLHKRRGWKYIRKTWNITGGLYSKFSVYICPNVFRVSVSYTLRKRERERDKLLHISFVIISQWETSGLLHSSSVSLSLSPCWWTGWIDENLSRPIYSLL